MSGKLLKPELNVNSLFLPKGKRSKTSLVQRLGVLTRALNEVRARRYAKRSNMPSKWADQMESQLSRAAESIETEWRAIDSVEAGPGRDSNGRSRRISARREVPPSRTPVLEMGSIMQYADYSRSPEDTLAR